MTQRCIIIGASHAAAQLSVSLRQQGWVGEIVVIGDEPYLPYQRPPLSKAFLAGEKTADELLIRPAALYEKQDIKFCQGEVTAIHRHSKTLSLADGSELKYDKLALCTGARVRKLNLPGSELNNVHYLRTMADVTGIKAGLSAGQRAVIIGGGYIGLETAASLRKQGLRVTLLESAERILQRVTAPELSAFYHRVHSEEGVEIHTGVSVSEITGNHNADTVRCTDGTEHHADLVIIGVGVLPNIELAEAAGLTVNNGVVVNEFCQTNDPNIVAAGDCTSHYNKHYSRQLRLESVPNAMEQAKSAAASLCGESKEHQSLPWFWSDQYELKLQIAGLSQGYDQVVMRGDITGRSFAAFYLKEGRLIATDCVNRPKEFMLSKKVISQRLAVEPSMLGDDSVDVKLLVAA